MDDCCKDKINISVYFDNNHAQIAEALGWDFDKTMVYKTYNKQWAVVHAGTKTDVGQINLKLAKSNIQFKNEIALLK